MRILVTTPYFLPVVGGSQNYITGLFAAVRKIDPSIQVDVLTYNTDRVAAEEFIDGLRVYRVPAIEVLPHQFALPNYWRLLQLLRLFKKQHRYDVVNAHTRFFDNAWWSTLAANYLGARSVLTDHCAAHPTHPSRLIRTITRIVDYLAIKLILPLYDQVMVVSKATQKFLENQGVADLVVISGGVDLNRFKKRHSLPPTLAFLEKNTKKTQVVSFIGRLVPTKGVTQFVEAVQQLTKKDKSLCFVIAGDGELSSTIKKAATKQIHVVGALNTGGVTALLERTTILVHPSTHHEGLPLTILEAGAAGCAVIATSLGESKQLLTNGRGLICQPTTRSITQRVSELITDRKRTREMGNKLRQHVRARYSWQHSAKKFLQQIVGVN